MSAPREPAAEGGERVVRRVVLVLLGVAFAAQLVTAARRDLFGDEAFYAACAARPAWSYADHPFLTAALVRGGVALAGWTSLGVRLLFALLGLALPLLSAALCRELGGTRRDAWLAAAGVTTLPLLALVPGLAVPDLPLLVLTQAALLAALRALRRDARGDWLALGLALAAAGATHLRAALLPASLVAGLLLTSRGRAALRSRGARLALVVGAVGALPVLLHGGDTLAYQLVERHHGGVHFDELLAFPVTQAALVTTPLMALLFLAAARGLLQRTRHGDAGAALALAAALLPLGVYFAASPVSDADHARQHWTLAAYLPLLAAAPPVARRWWRAGGLRRALALGAPALGLGVTLFALVDVHTGWPGTQALHQKFRGWSEAADSTFELLDALPPAERPRVLVADHYVLAAQLELAQRAAGREELPVFTLEHPKNAAHGRAPQYAAWGLDADALRARAGERALLVADLDATRTRHRAAWLAHLDAWFDASSLVATAREGWPTRPLELQWRLGTLRAAPPPALDDDAPPATERALSAPGSARSQAGR